MTLADWLLAGLRSLLATLVPVVLVGAMLIGWAEYQDARARKRHAAQRTAPVDISVARGNDAAADATSDDDAMPAMLKQAVKEGLDAFVAERAAAALLLQAATTVSTAKLGGQPRSFAAGTPSASDSPPAASAAMGPPRNTPVLRRSTRAASPAMPEFHFTVGGKAPGSMSGDSQEAPFDDTATM